MQYFPAEILLNITYYLSTKDFGSFRRTCYIFSTLVETKDFYRLRICKFNDYECIYKGYLDALKEYHKIYKFDERDCLKLLQYIFSFKDTLKINKPKTRQSRHTRAEKRGISNKYKFIEYILSLYPIDHVYIHKHRSPIVYEEKTVFRCACIFVLVKCKHMIYDTTQCNKLCDILCEGLQIKRVGISSERKYGSMSILCDKLCSICLLSYLGSSNISNVTIENNILNICV